MIRIARGSGRIVSEVMEMLKEYKKLATTFGKVKGQNMSKALPPQMLKQIGGTGGLQSLMKQLGSSKDLMGMFGGRVD